MSETSEERSKREFCRYLRDYHWETQVSFFYNNQAESDKAIENAVDLKRYIKRQYNRAGILWRINLKTINPKKVGINDAEGKSLTLPIHIFYLSQPIKKLILPPAFHVRFEDNLRYKKRTLTRSKIESTISAIKKQKPHNLEEHFKKDKVNRFGLLNKNHAIINEDTAF